MYVLCFLADALDNMSPGQPLQHHGESSACWRKVHILKKQKLLTTICLISHFVEYYIFSHFYNFRCGSTFCIFCRTWCYAKMYLTYGLMYFYAYTYSTHISCYMIIVCISQLHSETQTSLYLKSFCRVNLRKWNFINVLNSFVHIMVCFVISCNAG